MEDLAPSILKKIFIASSVFVIITELSLSHFALKVNALDYYVSSYDRCAESLSDFYSEPVCIQADDMYLSDTSSDRVIAFSDGLFSQGIPSSFSHALSVLKSCSCMCDAQLKQLNDTYKEQVQQQNILRGIRNRGAMGRLRIPSRGISVALFDTWEQSVCDAPDSACYFFIREQPIIGDHNYQAFKNLRRVVTGDKVIIDTLSGSQTYRVVERISGANADTDLVYRGTSQSLVGKYPNSICMYTCDGPGGINILAVYAVREG